MEPGYLLDLTYGSRGPTEWVEGVPERSFWTGTKLGGRDRYVVETFRCEDCGALRSYALTPKS